MVQRVDGPSLSLFAELPGFSRVASAAHSGGTGFGEMLQSALDTVNRYQLDSARTAEALALGDVQDVHSVMLATAKADLALQLTMQIRNKAIEAYQEISRMQI